MPSHDADSFLKEVCKQIKYKKAHTDISEELRNHIQDRIYDYIDSGMDEKTAAEKAVEAMGDPIEIGKELNRLHKPYLGWALSIVNTLIIILGFFTAFMIIPSIFSLFEPFGVIPGGNNVEYSVTINKKASIDDRTVVMKKLVVGKNGSIYIRYDEYSKPFSLGWSMSDFQIYDDKGNKYNYGGEAKGSVFITRHLIQIDNLKKDATSIILNYDFYNRKMRFEIPLKAGDNL